MAQSNISRPELRNSSGYSLFYTVYLHCAAHIFRKAAAWFTGPASLFTKHGIIETLGLGDGHVKYSVCIPKQREDSGDLYPLVFVIEGGGFILGQPSDGACNDRLLCENLNAVVLSVEYAKSPRYPFPHALLQLYKVLQWCMTSAAIDELGVTIDPRRIAIMGNSAGGNLAASLSLLTAFTAGPCAYFRNGLPKNYRQVAQVLLYPSLACNQLYRERYANAIPEVQTKSLPVHVAELMEISYLPPSVDKEQIFVAPLLIDSGLLKELIPSLAPTACYVAGMDCLKTEAIQYCRKLREAGVQVVVQEYAEAIHGFSHYPKDSPKVRGQDVESCWASIAEFLDMAFRM